MTDETKLRLDAGRGARAKALIENDLLNEAFTELEEAYIAKWRSTAVLDDKGREKLFIAVNVIGKVKEHLALVMANGSVAEAELKRLTDDEARKKRFGIL